MNDLPSTDKTVKKQRQDCLQQALNHLFSLQQEHKSLKEQWQQLDSTSST
jgi:hypothetical protein